ncbi:MAG: diacylglycerol kinase family protein [Candidatus Omnitrophica bacterium]|nr:diacylglycerol kinase family protein [Candidatus Omnitrophota bacterium]
MTFILGIIRSCTYAVHGILFAARSQRNFRIHLLAAVVVPAAAVALGFSRLELVLVILTVSLVILGELLNTGLEFLLNLLEARDHPTVRAVKDIAAGAVFMAVVGSVGIGVLLFGPRILAVLRR